MALSFMTRRLFACMAGVSRDSGEGLCSGRPDGQNRYAHGTRRHARMGRNAPGGHRPWSRPSNAPSGGRTRLVRESCRISLYLVFDKAQALGGLIICPRTAPPIFANLDRPKPGLLVGKVPLVGATTQAALELSISITFSDILRVY